MSTKSAFRFTSFFLTLALALSMLPLPAATVGAELEPQPLGEGHQEALLQDFDFGDAPEGGGAIAYPSLGVPGSFPTCVGVGPAGFVAHFSFGAWFGPTFETEPDGNAGLCPTCFPRYDVDECFADGDAGLIVPEPFTIDPSITVVPCPSSAGTPLGVACQPAVWGGNVDIDVHNHMPDGTIGFVNVLVDWNQDGAWGGSSPCATASAPEHVLVDFPIPNPFDGPLSALTPPGFLIGPHPGFVWARFSITEIEVGPDWNGEGFFDDGESEDYLLGIEPPPELDFGDAIDPTYPTLLASNGARHTVDGVTFLGASVDCEPDGQPDAAAIGDDQDIVFPPPNDDEDGVLFTSAMILGQPATVDVFASVPGLLNTWYDFDIDGDWADPGEHIFINQPLVPGANNLAFTVPAGAATGETFVRFRFNRAGGLRYDGPADDGEVEDYKVYIQEPVEGFKMHHPQYPDMSHTGIDVDMSVTPLADDFLCTESGTIDRIRIWASFANDILPANGPGSLTLALAIHANMPADDVIPWSRPGDLLWRQEFTPGKYTAARLTHDMPEWWYDPVTMLVLPDNHFMAFEYDFVIEDDPFWQEAGRIYWLAVQEVPPADPQYAFGWKTATIDLHFEDDATYLIAAPAWQPLTYPQEHAYYPETLDLAFVIFGGLEELEYGDAPEGSSAIAYPSLGVAGAFPTCTTIPPAGWWVGHDNYGAYFGPAFDMETDGNAGFCPNCFPPYDQDECFADGDAGLLSPEPFTIVPAAPGPGLSVVPCPNDPSGGTPLGTSCQQAVWGVDIDIDVHNHMPGGTFGFVNVLMDWNQDGRWAGASTCAGTAVPEHVLVDFAIPNPYDGPLSALMAPGSGFQIGPNPGYVWTRFSITEVPVGTDWNGEGSFEDGESEDYLLEIMPPEIDFGDALDPTYPTLLASNGARHALDGVTFLGAGVDPEPDGQPSAAAIGDDQDIVFPPPNDDEDGVLFITAIIPGQPATVHAIASVPGRLNAWFDFNIDGDWDEADEHIFIDQPLTAGVNTLTFNVPAGAQMGETFVRFRFSTQAGLSYVGLADDGEVEDYKAYVQQPKDHYKMHWPQYPDLSPTGLDVDMTDAPLADDFLCTQSGPINHIRIWGSFADDMLPADGPGSLTFQVAIHANIPAGPAPWSMPGELLWTMTFGPGQYKVTRLTHDVPEGWFDPLPVWWIPDNHFLAFQYDFFLGEDTFFQQADTIYWLEVTELVSTPLDYAFGWKTTTYDSRWMDDATYFTALAGWLPLTYPEGHAYYRDTLDLAFVVYQQPREYGDAPESSKAIAYPSLGVTGAFPTCWSIGPAGWVQHNSFGAWFGPTFDVESDGNAGLCPPPGCFPPYDQDECYRDGDAGLIVPEPFTIDPAVNVVPCPNSAGTPLGVVCQPAVWGVDIDIDIHNHMPGDARGFVNLLVDWNRNGAWGGASDCAGVAVPEHVLVDFPIPNPYDGPLSALMAAGSGFQIGPNPGHVWVRFSITEVPVGADWNGEGGFEDGESEDYLLEIAAPPPPEVQVTKALVEPLDGIAVVSDTITFTIRVANTGGTAITRLPLYDYYCPACLDFTSWSVPPTSVDHGLGVVHWEDLLAPGPGILNPGESITVTVDFHAHVNDTMYWKEAGWLDYAPKGMPDFDQKQDTWWYTPPPGGMSWYYCGPVAAANSLWWFDSKFEPSPVPPPTLNDGYALVSNFGNPWDDHDPQNVQRLVSSLAGLMATAAPTGTSVHRLAAGIAQYINNQGLGSDYTVHREPVPAFEWVEDEVRRSEDVLLLLGFWQPIPGTSEYYRVGGHYVTVAGIDSEKGLIAFSDPYRDLAEAGFSGRVLPNPHRGLHPSPGPISDTVHNDAKYASHDVYVFADSPSPGGIWGPAGYAPSCDAILNFQGQNEGDFANSGLYCNPDLPVFTEVEYAVAVSPITETIICAPTDNFAVVSGALDEFARQVPEAQGHARVTIIEAADLGIAKDDTPDPVYQGQVLTYTVKVSNPGPSEAEHVVVTDVLPTGVIYGGDTAGCVQGPPGTLTCDLGTLPSPVSISFQVTVTVPSAVSGLITNTAIVTSTTYDPDVANNRDAEETVVLARPRVEVVKTLVEPLSGKAGVSDTITFTIRITNTGSTTITKLPLWDYYCPACLEFTSWSIPPTSVDHTLGVVHWSDVLAGGPGILNPGESLTVTVDFHGVVSDTMYWKEAGWIDYAPKGMPDFDQKQDLWDNPPGSGVGWYYCGPVAAANSLWWFDSKFEPNPIPPPTINDGYPLVPSYHASWDDHDPRNVQRLVTTLAGLMGTAPGVGTNVVRLALGIRQHIFNQGLAAQYTGVLEPMPEFGWVEKEVRRSEDVILLLGFWQQLPTGGFERVGGHYVTVAGVDSENGLIAFSDPYFNRAELGWPGRVLPNPHLDLHPTAPPDEVHNDAKYASHDVYAMGPSPSPGGSWGPLDYALTCDYIVDFQGQNEGDFPNTMPCEPGLHIFTEVEYALAVSPITPTILCKPTDNFAVVSGAVDEYGTKVPEAQGHAQVSVNIAPTLGTVDPSSGSGPTGVTTYFTTTWKDANGWADLKQCYFHIGDSASIVNNVTLLYNAVKNRLWIRSDDGSAWLGGYAPGSVNTLENSQAKVHCALTTMQGVDDTVEVKWAIEFKAGYTGAKKTGLKCKDRDKARAKAKWKGTWTIF